jgi:glycerol-3-phosphate dehydrogenase
MVISATPLPTRRASLLAQLDEDRLYDLAVVGGGASGLGVALDAAARGLSVVLLESHDFAKGTSSRATKLLHGGVRYLAQGNISLVREALHERTTVLHNAPHLAQPLAFVMPSYHWWETPFYGLGLTLYDALAGRAGLGTTSFLGRQATLTQLPGVQPQGLYGAVRYWDGQFDDARLALALARTAALHGALLLNYCPVTGLIHEGSQVAGVRCQDSLSGRAWQVRARCVVNATGVWVDELRQMDAGTPSGHTRAVEPLVSPSQGVHLVVDQDFLGSECALMVPKTRDGRVLFAVPWLGKLILGTTDTPLDHPAREPEALDQELDFILGEAARYLRRAPTRADIRSAWVGLRPLVKPAGTDARHTKALSREHTILTSASGLLTVTGGKWTTYRAMAQDVLHACTQQGLIPARPEGLTKTLRLVGAQDRPAVPLSQAPGLHLYGAEEAFVRSLTPGGRWLTPGLSEPMVRFAARHEYALTVEDVLARRSRLLFLDAAAAASVAADVAEILEQETGEPAQAAGFCALAQRYLHPAVQNA